ncbi:MAG TPA: hypothetical protein VGE40_00110 [Bacilli bacterium]
MIFYELINSRLAGLSLLEQDEVLVKIEEIIHDYNLDITQKTTLSTKKGSIHYHLKQGNYPGVLEVTYWPQKNRLWLEIHDNRRAHWNEEIILVFSEKLAAYFGGSVSKTE